MKNYINYAKYIFALHFTILITMPFVLASFWCVPYCFFTFKEEVEIDFDYYSFLGDLKSYSLINFIFIYATYPTKSVKAESKRRRLSVFALDWLSAFIINPVIMWSQWKDAIALNDEYGDIYSIRDYIYGIYAWFLTLFLLGLILTI